MRLVRLCLSLLVVPLIALVVAAGCDSEDQDPGADPALWGELRIEGLAATSKVLILRGPGYDIERISGFDADGRPRSIPGLATEHPLVFEAKAEDARWYQAYFDAYLASPVIVGPRNGRIVIPKLDGSPSFAWALNGFVPAVPYRAFDGRVLFIMECNLLTNNIMGWRIDGDDPFGEGGSFNPETDRPVEVEGLPAPLYPSTTVDTRERTLTLTYDFAEGQGIYGWVKDTVEGVVDLRTVTVSTLDTNGTVRSRAYYPKCFPIRYEHLTGFDLDARCRARVVLSYNYAAAEPPEPTPEPEPEPEPEPGPESEP